MSTRMNESSCHRPKESECHNEPDGSELYHMTFIIFILIMNVSLIFNASVKNLDGILLFITEMKG